MKYIGVLEVHCHVKFFYTTCKICKTKNTNVTIFTTKELFLRLEKYLENKEDYNVVLKRDNEGLNSFLKRVKKICNEKIDLLFVNTIQLTCFYLPRFFGFNPRCKTILTVHTANAWLKPKPVINIKKLVRTVDTNISSFIAYRFILPKFDAINVLYSPIKDYIFRETNYDKEIFTIPFNFFDKTRKIIKKSDKKIKFVIPGQIEKHRRDYNIVLDAFEKIFDKFKVEICLYLLGYPVGSYGKHILKRCKKLRKQGHNIIIFDTFVPEEKYNEIMVKSDFIISPIRIKTKGMGEIQELYGVTKASAVIFEAIQYAKPLALPENFNIIKEMESSTLKYTNSEDLEDKLIKILSNKQNLNNLKQKAYDNSQMFSLGILQDYFENNILKIL